MSWLSRNMSTILTPITAPVQLLNRIREDVVAPAVRQAEDFTGISGVKENAYKARQVQFLKDKGVTVTGKESIGELHDMNVAASQKMMQTDLENFRAENIGLMQTKAERTAQGNKGAIRDQAVDEVFTMEGPEAAIIAKAVKNEAIAKTMFAPAVRAPKPFVSKETAEEAAAAGAEARASFIAGGSGKGFRFYTPRGKYASAGAPIEATQPVLSTALSTTLAPKAKKRLTEEAGAGLPESLLDLALSGNRDLMGTRSKIGASVAASRTPGRPSLF